MPLGMGNKGQPKYERDMLRFFMKFTLAAEKMDDDTEYTDTKQGVLKTAMAQHRQEAVGKRWLATRVLSEESIAFQQLNATFALSTYC